MNVYIYICLAGRAEKLLQFLLLLPVGCVGSVGPVCSIE